ncbi:MAG TPA: LLM class flavin-dependent oxidoreductase [Candidatus Limnocylindrales bacterium]|nr:LLM class flavin-dependent oxidoreductase [Candidatus Limnocylindrales bacterium]
MDRPPTHPDPRGFLRRGRRPIGVCIGVIGADPAWWLESARRLDEAGYAGIWAWDHFVSRGDRRTPVLECWTTLAMAAASTRRATVGSFVTNVMNRHPAVLARMVATIHVASGGRAVLGIGIGGHPAEHEAYGIDFPDVPERVARLEEAVEVIRALWTGGPVDLPGRFYALEDAVAHPRPEPPPPIVVGGETAAGARLAARIGDGWTGFSDRFETLVGIFDETLAAAGRRREDVVVLLGVQEGWGAGDALRGSPWVEAPIETLETWRARGADGVVVQARTPADVDALVRAAERW